jgi:uncharacterized protein YbjQ (UPF0145 family)
MRLVTSETIPDRPIEQGDMVFACAVSGANILRDMREAVINTIGGHMTKYEALLDQTIARALEVLSERARQQGYDGVLGIRISHPIITSGAIEVVVAGTGVLGYPQGICRPPCRGARARCYKLPSLVLVSESSPGSVAGP